MAKNHLTRLAAPKTWQVQRRATKFITKPNPGPHKLTLGLPLGVALKEVLGYSTTTREVKKILNQAQVKIDGKPIKDFRRIVGLFDVIQFAKSNECFRTMLNRNGKLGFVKIADNEAKTKLAKIIGKTMVEGRTQLNLYDGKNIMADANSYNVGDTLVLSLHDYKISKHLKLGKNMVIFLTGGKHIGEAGSVEDIVGKKIIYKDANGDLVETLKEYAFVIGDSKTLVKAP